MTPNAMATGWEEWTKQRLAPRVFFAGVILGFALCCLGGRKAAAAFPFRNFVRFEAAICPEGMYYPTALQVRALARRAIPKDKIAVIIGGSSILRGHGQVPKDLWSAHLQAMLGDDFQVLNLAMDAGAPNEFGQLAAEMLLRDGRRVIYVCNCMLKKFADYPDGTMPNYRYFFHDAHARGLLLPFADRDAALAKLEPQRRANEGLDELQLQTRANRLLSFNDLWNVAAYEVGSTVWVKVFGGRSWRARKTYAAEQVAPRPARTQRELRQTQGMIVQHALANTAADRDRFKAQVRVAVPEALRPRTLVTINRFDPKDVALLEPTNPGIAERLEAKQREVAECLAACGLQAVDGCVALTADDFHDRFHLEPSGGVKLARELAPAIRKRARQLGYITKLRDKPGA